MLLWILIPIAVYALGAIITFTQIPGMDMSDSASFAGIGLLLSLAFKVLGAVFWPIIVLSKIYGFFKS